LAIRLKQAFSIAIEAWGHAELGAAFVCIPLYRMSIQKCRSQSMRVKRISP
jgi:hypothetical protein